MTLTIATARKLGYEIVRGAYQETPDDRLNGWYIQRLDAREVCRLGPGHPTRKTALAALDADLRMNRSINA